MVTVLFADLVDSTGLARRLDPERSREVLGRFFDAASTELQALRGRPEKFIGDAVMAVFGLPTVHEDDALRAVARVSRSAAACERLGDALGLAEPLEVHVGVASGEAATGIGPAGQLLVTGPVVNAAARLQQAAGPGAVLAGETTARAHRQRGLLRRPARRAGEGLRHRARRLPRRGLTPRSARRTIPFVGRSSELAILRESLARAANTGRPVLVTVLGESGIGKSRLADELVAGLGDDVAVLAGHAAPVHRHRDVRAGGRDRERARGLRRGRPAREGEAPPARARRAPCATRAMRDRIVERLSLLFGMAERHDESAFVRDVRAGFVALVDGLARERPARARVRGRPHDATRRCSSWSSASARRRARGAPSAGPRARAPRALRRAPVVGRRHRERGPAPARPAVRHGVGRPRAAGIGQTHRRRRGGGDRRARRRQPVLHHRDDRHAPARVLRCPRGAPPADGAGRRRGPARRPRRRACARSPGARPRSSSRSTSTSCISSTPGPRSRSFGCSRRTEILVREREHAERWRVRHATLKDVAYASQPKRERVRMHGLIAERLLETGHGRGPPSTSSSAAFA